MLKSRLSFLAIGLIVGAVVGLNAGGWWPQIPVHAVASQGHENFILCTAPLDDEVEGVFFLDGLTGDLKCAAIGLTGFWNALFTYNVNNDFKVKNPKYLMVSGHVYVRSGAGMGNLSPSRSSVYVAEVTTGQIAAYYVPWNTAARTNNQAQVNMAMGRWGDVWKARDVAVRNTGASK